MKKCIFYGNCQAVALSEILTSSLKNTYNIIPVKPVHKLTQVDIQNLYDCLPLIDLLIIQPISDKYKNNYLLSTSSILKHINKECKIIMIPVCYFNFYYPFVTYLKTKIEDYCEYYHDANLIELYRENKYNKSEIILKFYEMVNNENLLFKEDPLTVADKSLIELKRREGEIINLYNKDTIKITEFIKDNYKQNLLFYTRNHPTKILFNFIANNICTMLNITFIDNYIDPLKNKHPPLYKAIQKYVEFDVSTYCPILADSIGLVNVADKMITVIENGTFIFN